MKAIMVAVFALLLGFNAQASCLGSFDDPASENFSYWKTAEGQTWINSYGECWVTIEDASYSHAEHCGEQPQAQTLYFRIPLGANFHFDKSYLRIVDVEVIVAAFEQLQDAGLTVTGLRVVGHTDSIGTVAYNEALGHRRATSAAALLAELTNGVDISHTSMGELSPIADNTTPAGRFENRRVEIEVDVEYR